jgi:hypothetical protein
VGEVLYEDNTPLFIAQYNSNFVAEWIVMKVMTLKPAHEDMRLEFISSVAPIDMTAYAFCNRTGSYKREDRRVVTFEATGRP